MGHFFVTVLYISFPNNVTTMYLVASIRPSVNALTAYAVGRLSIKIIVGGRPWRWLLWYRWRRVMGRVSRIMHTWRHLTRSWRHLTFLTLAMANFEFWKSDICVLREIRSVISSSCRSQNFVTQGLARASCVTVKDRDLIFSGPTTRLLMVVPILSVRQHHDHRATARSRRYIWYNLLAPWPSLRVLSMGCPHWYSKALSHDWHFRFIILMFKY